uniref:Uncharacterized protein n=1 Tax=Coprinellus micaceus TaxID=71717 RepID=A0A4Y7SAR7_COPMI|nr:hypothetical protein FA13DRAFT_1720245 [Coprinellus micaceus]
MPLSRRPTLPSIHSLDLPFMAPSCSSSFSASPFFSTYRRSSSLVPSEGSEDWETSRSPSPASSLSSFSSSSSFSPSTSVSSRPPSPPSDPSPLEPPTSSFPFSRPSYNEPPVLRTYPSASQRCTSSASSYGSTKLRLAPCALADLDAVILVPSSSSSHSSSSPHPPSISPFTAPTQTTPTNPEDGKAKPLLLTGPAAQAFKHPSALKALSRVRVHPYRIMGAGPNRRASVATTTGFGGAQRSGCGSGWNEGRRSVGEGMRAIRAALSRISVAG